MTDEGSESNGFLKRWSRRKRQPEAPRQTDSSDAAATEIEAGTDRAVDDFAAQAPAPVDQEDTTTAAADDLPASGLTDEDMPAVETLNGDSDYSPFLSEGVSKELRNMALKKLFFSGKFAIRDGLDDYDDDFTRFEPLGNTVTSDMKFHQRRKERERLAKLEEEARQQQEAGVAEAEESVADDSVEHEAVSEQQQPATDPAAEPADGDSNDEVTPADAPLPHLTKVDDAPGAEEAFAAGRGKLSRRTHSDSNSSEGDQA